MKLIVQIPCFNEADTLPAVLGAIPRRVAGIDRVEVLVVDDGSSDGTAAVAAANGADHVVRHTRNRGLARAFRTGLETSLRLGADVIVNTDGDGQYCGADIPKLLAPVLDGSADIVIGDRGGLDNPHFPVWKRRLQVTGSTVVQRLSGVDIPDAVSGFRALSRQAAAEVNVVSEFSYTIEMLIQAGAKRLSVVSVPITTNAKTRPSRLFRSVPQFLRLSAMTMLRVYTMYKPLRVFVLLGSIPLVIGLIPVLRFLWQYLAGAGTGHVQSLVLGSVLILIGFFMWLFGILADLIAFNRKLLEQHIARQTAGRDDTDRDGERLPLQRTGSARDDRPHNRV